jgi:hypothetical protein
MEGDAMRARAVARMLAIGALALLLAGCFKVNMDVEVSPENTVSGSAIVAVDESLLELSGQSVDDFLREMDLSQLPEQASAERYEEGGFVGQEIAFEDVPLEEFSGEDTLGAGTGEELSIVRRGDEFHVSGMLDMSGEEFGAAGEIPPGVLEGFEFRISITFPGEVKSATGEIDGNTVTWEPEFGQTNPIQAVASAIPSASSPWLMILLIVAGVAVVAAIAFLLLRKPPAPATPIEGTADFPIQETPATAPPATAVPPTEPAPRPPEAPGSAVPPPENEQEEDRPPPVPPVSD